MHLHLDCFAGLAGDMLLGALVDLGASTDAIEAELEKLGLPDWSLSFPRRDAGHGLQGLGVEVRSDELSSARRGLGDGAAGSTLDHHPASDDAAPEEDADGELDALHDTQEHEPVALGAAADLFDKPTDQNQTLEWEDVAIQAVVHGSGDTHAPGGHRTWAEIAERIAAAELSARAEKRAQAVFRRLAEAEARVHGVSVEAVHFHEVGAVDSVVDIVGAAIALDLLDVETISATPVPLGRGFTDSLHGRIPIPAPATLECLRGVPCFDSGLDVELVTPTGAGFVGALAESFTRFPELTVARVGYGAGTRRLPDRPNVLRAILGERAPAAPLQRDEVWELAANLDDQSGESLALALEALWKAGAADVWTAPIAMKKGRHGQQLSVLAPPQHRDAVLEAMLRHTTSLGVRLTRHERTVLAREVVAVPTRYGEVRVKVGRGLDGSVWNVAPEADDCARAAEEAGVPAKLVFQAALGRALEDLS